MNQSESTWRRTQYVLPKRQDNPWLHSFKLHSTTDQYLNSYGRENLKNFINDLFTGLTVCPAVGTEGNGKRCHCFYTKRTSVHYSYNAFYINLMHIIGRTELITFRCLAILLAQQAVRYVKQSKQSAPISNNVASCCWDISLIELSKHCYCSNCSNIHQLTHKHNHSTVFLPSHTVLSSTGTRSRLQNGI